MVVHWRKNRGDGWFRKAAVNGIGAFVTGFSTVFVVLVAKFVDGAWITLLFIPLTIYLFVNVRRHYHSIGMVTASRGSCQRDQPQPNPPLPSFPSITGTISPSRGLNLPLQRLSPEVIALRHVNAVEHSEPLETDWDHYVARPFREESAESRPFFTCCPRLTDSSSSPSFSSFWICRRKAPVAPSSWSYPRWWKTRW